LVYLFAALDCAFFGQGMAVQRSNINQPNNSMPERTTRTLINSLAKLLRCQKKQSVCHHLGDAF